MNEKAQEAFEEALAKSKANDWRGAAKKYKAAFLYADNHVVKANALKKEAEAYRNAKLYYKEFKCLKTLLENAPEQINFKETVDREYEIANLFYSGYRETPYTWMPWIKDDNHALEIYQAIQKQSPYAKYIPTLLLKLCSLYLDDGKNKKAEEAYKVIIEEHGNSTAAKTAYLDLAHLYLQLAKRGDGDGHYTTEARSILQEFIKQYPNSPETLWAKNSITQTYEIGAERLFRLAEYYNDKGNPKTAKRYIRDILVNYPETKAVVKAEGMLDSIDMPLYPAPKESPKKKVKEKSKYAIKSLPQVSHEILVIPQNSENKWLRPIIEEPLLKDKKVRTEYEKKI
jgi:outer membrane assembly lipoprotein YfiO